MNNQFNLNDLRSDTADHSDWFIFGFGDHDAMIDFIIEALIGSDYYAVMLRNPLTTIRFDFRGSHQVLNAHDPSDPFLHSLNVLIAAYLA